MKPPHAMRFGARPRLEMTEFMSGRNDPPEAGKRCVRFDVNKDGKPGREEFVHMGALPAK